MAYSYEKQEEVEQIISSCRPENDDFVFWAEQIKAQVSAEDLDQHYLYLTSRMDELMDESARSGLSISGGEHFLELAKLAEVSNHLDAVEIALGRK